MDSEELFESQVAQNLTIHRSEEELSQENAPLVSLADVEQLRKGKPILDAHKKKRDEFRDHVEKATTIAQVRTAQIGERQKDDVEPVTDSYISVTSGFSIASLKHDLDTKWKYQRYNGSNSAEMQNLKGKLTDLSAQFDVEVTFTSYEDIRDACGVLVGKYKALIAACETYLAKSKNPHTIAGKSRKSMAQRLLRAAMSEMEMLEDSAINCFDEKKLLDANTASVKLKWDDILHHGRLRAIDTNRDKFYINMHADANTGEVVYRGSEKREMITFATTEAELKGCRRIVAMSTLAQKLGFGRLAGGEEMSTRMTTMLVGDNVVTGVVTTGITKKSLSQYQYEMSHDIGARPGEDVLPERKTSYGADYLRDLLAIPFIDYLCGINRDSAEGFGLDKIECASGLVLGRIQTQTHELAKSGFGKEFKEFEAPEGTWIDFKLVQSILGLDEQTLLDMMTGVLDQEERAAAVLRLNSLKKWILERIGPEDAPLPEMFKDEDDYAELVENPKVLSAYATSQAGKIHKLLDPKIAETTQTRDLSVNTSGMLVPLLTLAGRIGEPVGKQAKKLEETLGGITEEINKFNSYRSEEVKFSESVEDFEKEIEAEFDPIDIVRKKCKAYLILSDDPKDIQNRIAVSALLQATYYQEKIYREHVMAMRTWAQRSMAKGTDRSFDLVFDDLFKETIYIAQKTGKAKESTIEEMYARVPFTREELCQRTGTEILGDVEDDLFDSTYEKEDNGQELDTLIDATYEASRQVSRELVKDVSEGIDGFLHAIAHLKHCCDTYLEVQGKKFLKGSLNSVGRNRKKIVKRYLKIINEEYGIFLDYSDVRVAKADSKALQRLMDYCIQNGIEKEDVWISALCVAAKRDLLAKQEKDILSGEAVRAAKKKREKKEAKSQREAAEREKIEKRATLPPPKYIEKDPREMEVFLSGLLDIAVIPQTTTDLSQRLTGKKISETEPEQKFAKTLREIVALRDEPVFSSVDVSDYKRRLKEKDPSMPADVILRSGFISRYNAIADKMQRELEPELQRYYDRGVSNSSTSKKYMNAVNDALFWEFYAFKNDERSDMDNDKILGCIKLLLSAGKPLGDITYTDLTNVVKMETAVSKPFTVGKKTLEPGLRALSAALTAKKGKKAEIEFQAVADGLASLIAAKASDDLELVGGWYDDLIAKCERYLENHSGKTDDKTLLVKRTRLVCMFERLGL